MLREIKRGRGRRHLDDSGAVEDHGIHEGRVRRGLCDEDVRLTHGGGRDHGGDHVPLHGRRDGRGAEPADEDDAEGRRQAARRAEGEGHARGGGDALGRGQGGEGHDGEGDVGARAGLDEGRGEGEDGVETEGGAVGVRGGDLFEVEALDGGVEGLGDEDGARDAEVGGAVDEGGGAEVGGYADALEDRGEGDEGFGVGVGEGVGAGRDGLGAGGHEGGGEELDVLFLVVGDVLEVGVVLRAEAGVREVFFRHA